MVCFHEKTSDIDLLVVVQWELEDKVKRQYMDMVVVLNEQTPAKGQIRIWQHILQFFITGGKLFMEKR